jgi:hypothetical protein
VIAVTFTVGTVTGTGTGADVGETVELDDALAVHFVKIGRAYFADGSPAPEDPGIVTVNGDPMTDDTPTKKMRAR